MPREDSFGQELLSERSQRFVRSTSIERPGRIVGDEGKRLSRHERGTRIQRMRASMGGRPRSASDPHGTRLPTATTLPSPERAARLQAVRSGDHLRTGRRGSTERTAGGGHAAASSSMLDVKVDVDIKKKLRQ